MWVGSYSRKSRALGDPDASDVVAHQLRECDRMAAADGIPIPAENRIAEVGSSESLDERPRLAAQLVAFSERPPLGGGLLYCTEVSRLSRADMEEIGRIMRVLRTANVKVRVPGHTYDLTLPHDEMFFTFSAAQARCEIQQYRVRVNQTREKQFEEARVRNGRVPWGYVWDKGKQEVRADIETFPRLVICCKEILTNGVLRLAEKNGVSPRVLYTALTSPMICGHPGLRYGRTLNGSTYKVLPRSEWKIPEATNTDYPHACSLEEFLQIQAVFQERRKRKTKTTGANGWCRDVVRFIDQPGSVILSGIGARRKDRPSAGRPVYERRGPSRTVKGQHQPGERLAYIDRTLIHDAAYEALLAALSDPESLQALVEQYCLRQAEKRRPAGSVSPQQVRLEDARRQYQDAVDAEYDAAEPLRSALKQRRVRLEQEIASLQFIEREAARETAHESALLSQLQQLPDLAASFRGNWAAWPEEKRRAIANGVIARIECRYEKAVGGAGGVRCVERVVLQPWFCPEQKEEEEAAANINSG